MPLTWLHKTAVSGKKKATGKQFNYEKEHEETRKGINGSRKAEWLKWEKFNLSPEVRSYRKWSFILKDDGSGSDWEEIETKQSAEDETVFSQGTKSLRTPDRPAAAGSIHGWQALRCAGYALDMVAQDSCTFHMVHIFTTYRSGDLGHYGIVLAHYLGPLGNTHHEIGPLQS